MIDSMDSTMNQQPVVCWETPSVFWKLPDVPNVWIKRRGVYFTAADKKSFKTDPPLYRLEGVYEEIDKKHWVEGTEEVTIFNPETFDSVTRWFLKIPEKESEVMKQFNQSSNKQVGQ